MKYALIEVQDDFEKGQCHDCPLYADNNCVFHCRYDECPLEIKEEYEGEDKDADKKCTYKETGCGSCKRQLDCPIEADTAESE